MTNSEIREIPRLDIGELFDNLRHQLIDKYQDSVMVIDFSRKNAKQQIHSLLPARLEDFSFIMVCSGECTISINYIPFSLKADSFIVLKESYMLSGIKFSPDFTGYHLVINKDFLHTSVGNKVIPAEAILKRENLYPVLSSNEENFQLMDQFMNELFRNMQLNNHPYQNSLVQNSICNIITHLWTISANVSQEELGRNTLLSVHENILRRFSQLVHEYCTEKREVSFYAAELCVSPVHLNRIIKKVTGKTATRHITDMVTGEAKLLLHQSSLTIQQIAAKLNFSDQAAFSKFFRKNTNMSPIEYRRRLGIR